MMNYKYKIGDDVIYINDNGVNWGKRKIIGLDTRAGRNTYYIEPTETPWFSVGEEYLHEIKAKKQFEVNKTYSTRSACDYITAEDSK